MEARLTRAVIVVVSIGSVLVVVGALGAALWLGGGPVSRAGWEATGWVAGIIAVLALPVGVLSWAVRRSAQALEAPTTDEINQLKNRLAGRLKEQWEREAKLRMLNDPVPMPVRWQLTSHQILMDRTDNVLGSDETFFNEASDDIYALVERFRALPRRRLAILGGPGGGKTTLAMQILLRLLTEWTEDEPVPVLVSVAGWDADKYPTLASWLTHRIDEDFPFLRASALGKTTAHHLAARGALLPVLDGLDELPKKSRSAVVTALNRSLGGGPLILTSRYREFSDSVTESGDVLASTAVVIPRKLDPFEVAKYLEKCLRVHNQQEKWKPILAHLRDPRSSHNPCPSLHSIISTPLGLWLVRSVYLENGMDPAPLLDSERFPSREALEAFLLDRIIESVITTHRDHQSEGSSQALPFLHREGYDSDKVRDRLGYIAYLLSHASADGKLPETLNLAWWELGQRVFPEGGTWRQRIYFLFFLGGLMGLSGFFFGMITFSFVGALHSGFRGLVFGGLAGGVALGAMNAFLNTVSREIYSLWSSEGPGYVDFRISGRFGSLVRNLTRSVLQAVAFSFLFVGVMLGFMAWNEEGIRAGIVVGVISALLAILFMVPIFGLVGGVVDWMQASSLGGRIIFPISSWKEDRFLNIMRGVLWGVALGSGGGLLIGMVSGSYWGLATGILFAYVFGIRGMLARKGHSAWSSYMVVTYYLAWKRLLPRRLMPFLDEVHRVGLLRTVGPIYQFRHARLQDHLARTYLGRRK